MLSGQSLNEAERAVLIRGRTGAKVGPEDHVAGIASLAELSGFEAHLTATKAMTPALQNKIAIRRAQLGR